MKDYPDIIEIQFSNMCNANCIICPYRSMHYVADKMSDKLFEKFLQDINGKNIKRIIPYLGCTPKDRPFLI